MLKISGATVLKIGWGLAIPISLQTFVLRVFKICRFCLFEVTGTFTLTLCWTVLERSLWVFPFLSRLFFVAFWLKLDLILPFRWRFFLKVLFKFYVTDIYTLVSLLVVLNFWRYFSFYSLLYNDLDGVCDTLNHSEVFNGDIYKFFCQLAEAVHRYLDFYFKFVNFVGICVINLDVHRALGHKFWLRIVWRCVVVDQ